MIKLDVYAGLVRLSDDIIQKRTRLQLKTSDFVSPDGKDFLSSLNFFFSNFWSLSGSFSAVLGKSGFCTCSMSGEYCWLSCLFNKLIEY